MAELEPVQINSYIVLDLETTGLPQITLRTKITELSILCLHRSHIVYTHENTPRKRMPRVVNKLNLCIYPKRLVSPGAADVSGLSNELLQSCKSFDADLFDIVNSMINFMDPPVCILAHNGNRFDFPILRSEIANIGKAFADNVYCADTLPAFREFVYKTDVPRVEIERFDYLEMPVLNTTVDIIDDENEEPVKDVIDLEDILTDDESWGSESFNNVLCMAAEEAERQYLKEVKEINLENVRRINETSPVAKKTGNRTAKKKLIDKNKKVSIRELFKDDENKKSLRLSYRLKDVYKHLIGKELINAHRADSDTHALLECVVAIGPPLLDWIDLNCKPFNDIKKLW